MYKNKKLAYLHNRDEIPEVRVLCENVKFNKQPSIIIKIKNQITDNKKHSDNKNLYM